MGAEDHENDQKQHCVGLSISGIMILAHTRDTKGRKEKVVAMDCAGVRYKQAPERKDTNFQKQLENT